MSRLHLLPLASAFAVVAAGPTPSVAALHAATVPGDEICVAQGGGKSTSNWTHVDDRDRRLSLRWKSGACELRVDARGAFAVRPDLSGFTRVDGTVDLEVRDGDRRWKVRVTGDGARLDYAWTPDSDAAFGGNRSEWLAGVLVALERRTAMLADSRVPALLRQGGSRAVLDEALKLTGDHARRVYYTTLLAQARLDDAGLTRLLRDAGATMRSDHERAEVLLAVAARGTVSDAVARDVIGVAGAIGSDFEKRRALAAVLASAATARTRSALFAAAATIASDFELAELLIGAQRRNLVDSLTSADYFGAVARIGSDHERRRTLAQTLRLTAPAPVLLHGVLRSAEGIRSDFELAELLVEFAHAYPVRGALREAFLRATRTIQSDHEYRRVLQALLEQDRTA